MFTVVNATVMFYDGDNAVGTPLLNEEGEEAVYTSYDEALAAAGKYARPTKVVEVVEVSECRTCGTCGWKTYSPDDGGCWTCGAR